MHTPFFGGGKFRMVPVPLSPPPVCILVGEPYFTCLSGGAKAFRVLGSWQRTVSNASEDPGLYVCYGGLPGGC